MSLIEEIRIENLLNCILVNENVRPAMLLQPVNYHETSGKDPVTKSILHAIKKQFPELLFTEDYETYQGIIISKTEYHGQDISLERMGQILGYPCYQDFEHIDPAKNSYSMRVVAKEKNGMPIELFANVCKDTKKIKVFKQFARKAQSVLNREEYKKMLNGIEIVKVDVDVDVTIPVQALIDKLIKNKRLNKNEIDRIDNILYNFGFSEEKQLYFSQNFQYTNPLHRGILLDLLIKEKNDILSPFFPLYKYPEQQKKVDEIIAALEKDIVDVLEKTKLPSRYSRVTKKNQPTFVGIK